MIVRFQVLDQHGNRIGELHPKRGASIRNDTTARIHRVLSGVSLSASEAADVNPYSDRVKVTAKHDGVTYELGTFLWSPTPKVRDTNGVSLNGAVLYDQTFILDNAFGQSGSSTVGERCTALVRRLAEQAGFWDVSIPDLLATFSEPFGWAAEHMQLDTMRKAAEHAACILYFSGPGALTVDRVPIPDGHHSDFAYGDGQDSSVIDGSIVETDDTWGIPNRYVAVSNTAESVPVMAVYDIPASHPASRKNRGFSVTRMIDASGATSSAQAYQIARDAYLKHRAAETVSFDTLPNPAHDTWNIVDWRGVPHLEESWNLPLDGGPMSHLLRKVHL